MVVYTIIKTGTKLTWDESKRVANLQKQGLDFADAGDVLDSAWRLDVPVLRNGEARTLSFSYVLGALRVLAVVRTNRDGTARVVSYRNASSAERKAYHEWLETE